jgi:hypothetical protein
VKILIKTLSLMLHVFKIKSKLTFTKTLSGISEKAQSLCGTDSEIIHDETKAHGESRDFAFYNAGSLPPSVTNHCNARIVNQLCH